MQLRLKPLAAFLAALFAASQAGAGTIPAAHVYHNHMPNFWPFYAVDPLAKYNATRSARRCATPTTLTSSS